MGLDQNAQRALEIYHEAQRQKAAGKLPAELQANVAPIRVRLETDIDRGKADPSCKRCHGTGELGRKLIPGNRGCEPAKVPIICRCVAAGGGVKPDHFDRMLTTAMSSPPASQSAESINLPDAPADDGNH
jgi:hypothetical protein